MNFDKAVELISKSLIEAGMNHSSKPIEDKQIQTKGYIFISYAEEDSSFVNTLKEFMSTQGYAYWDYRESKRDYQSLIADELENVIKNAEATISIQSNNWRNSEWSKKEYYFSKEIGIPVFLLRFEKMEPTLATAGIPYIDFSSNINIGFKKLEYEFKQRNL
jgi:hypothetical protein